MTVAQAALLAAARAVPLAWTPPLGAVSRATRGVVAALLAAVAVPFLVAAPAPDAFALALFRETLIGIVLALVVAVPFAAAAAAGALVDRAVAPAPYVGRARLAETYALFALALFAALGGPGAIARAWAHSYGVLPVAALPSAAGGVRLAIELGARLIALALALAAPPLAALLLADLAAGLIARAQPALAEALAVPALRRLAALMIIALALGASVGALRNLGSVARLAGPASDGPVAAAANDLRNDLR